MQTSWFDSLIDRKLGLFRLLFRINTHYFNTDNFREMISTSLNLNEIKRLQTLLPKNLLSRIKIATSTDIRAKLIKTTKLTKDRYSIKIDSIAWQEIDLDERNLLFWHEIARIQQHSVKSYGWESLVFAAGLGMSILEVTSQHVLLLGVYLLLTTVAGWQLYYNNRGEGYLRLSTQADCGAILLAQQFGYSLPKAYRSLHRAIKMLSMRSPQALLAKEYQTRLQVLEISASEQKKKDRSGDRCCKHSALHS